MAFKIQWLQWFVPPTLSFTNLDRCKRAKYFESILTTLEDSFIFCGSWESSKNWLELKIEPPTLSNLITLPKSVKHCEPGAAYCAVPKIQCCSWLKITLIAIFSFCPFCKSIHWTVWPKALNIRAYSRIHLSRHCGPLNSVLSNSSIVF